MLNGRLRDLIFNFYVRAFFLIIISLLKLLIAEVESKSHDK